MTCWRSSVVAQRDTITADDVDQRHPHADRRVTTARSISMTAGMINAATSHRPIATAAPTRACGPFVAAISAWNSRSRRGSRNRQRQRVARPEGSRPSPEAYAPAMAVRSVPRVTRMSSSSTSRRLPGPPSTASNRSRTLCPANAIDRDRGRPPDAVDVRMSPGDPEDLHLAAVRPLDDRAQHVGRRRRRAVGEDIGERQALAGGRRQGDRLAIGSSSARRGRSRSRTPGRGAGDERLRARARGPQLLRAVARASMPGRPATNRPLRGPCRCRRGSTTKPRATSRSSSNAPQRAIRTAAPRTESGHPARSIRYRTASLFRPVSDGDQRVVRVVLRPTSRTCRRRSGRRRTGSRATCRC